MNLFKKAASNIALSPSERSLLKLLKGLGYVVVVNVLIAIASYLASNNHIDLALMAKFVIGQVALVLLLSLEKYFTAQGDVPLAAGIGSLEAQLQSRVPSATSPQDAPKTPPSVTPSEAQQPVSNVQSSQLAASPSQSAQSSAQPQNSTVSPDTLFTLPDNYLTYPTNVEIPVVKP